MPTFLPNLRLMRPLSLLQKWITLAYKVLPFTFVSTDTPEQVFLHLHIRGHATGAPIDNRIRRTQPLVDEVKLSIYGGIIFPVLLSRFVNKVCKLCHIVLGKKRITKYIYWFTDNLISPVIKLRCLKTQFSFGRDKVTCIFNSRRLSLVKGGRNPVSVWVCLCSMAGLSSMFHVITPTKWNIHIHGLSLITF